jgi:hypothetical protein
VVAAAIAGVEREQVAESLLLLDQQPLIHLEQAVAARHQRLQRRGVALVEGVPGAKVLRQRLRHVERRVRRDDFLDRAILRIEIDRERLPRQVRLVGRQHDPPEAVPRVLVGLEHERAIEKRQEALHLVGLGPARIRMQLDRAAPRLLPFLVEIDEEVDAPMQHPTLVDVEVDVHVEPLARHVLVRAAAEQRVVGDEVRNAGQLAHRLQERRRIDVLVEAAIERADAAHALDDGLPPDVPELVDRALRIEGGEVAQQRLAGVFVEEMLDGDVAKRLRVLEFTPDRRRPLEDRTLDHDFAITRRKRRDDYRQSVAKLGRLAGDDGLHRVRDEAGVMGFVVHRDELVG